MMMNHPIKRRSHLMAGAAALAMMTAAPAAAQIALPNNGAIQSGTVEWRYSPGGGGFESAGPIVRPNGGGIDTLTLRIGSDTALINWDSFVVGRQGGNPGTVSFVNNNGGNPFAVLNRVTGGGQSNILGVLEGAGNNANGGSIWIINPNGVIFGPQSSVTNMASFVASTLPLDPDSVTLFASSGPFAGGLRFAGTTGAINVQGGANINVGGPILMVSPRITVASGASVTANAPGADDGDVAFVVARDATVQLSSTSLISVGIAAGTTVGDDALLIAGTVQGERVFGVVANATTTLATLLNVSGSIIATQATATENGIILRAGSNGPDITIDPASGAAAMAITGTLTADTGRIDIAGNAAVTAGQSAAGGDVVVSGASVLLNASLTSERAVSVTATNGAVTSAAGVALQSNTADAGNAANGVTVSATQGVGSQGQGFAIDTVAGDGVRAAASVTAGAGSAVNLGAVTASELTIQPGQPDAVGAIRLGAVDISSGLTLDNDGLIDIVSLTAVGDVSLTAGGSLTTGSIDNGVNAVTLAGTSITVNDANTLSIVSAAASAGAVSLTAAGALTATGAITSTGTGAGVTLAGSSIDVSNGSNTATIGTTGSISLTTAGAVTTDAMRARGGISIAGGPTSVTSDRIEANGNISITTGGALTVTEAGGFGTRDGLLDNDLINFTGAAGQNGNMLLSAASFAVGNSIASTGDLSFTRSAVGVLDLTTLTLTADSNSSATPDGDLTLVNADGFTLNGAGGGFSFTRSLSVTGAFATDRALTLTGTAAGSISFANNITLGSGGALTASAGSIAVRNITGQLGSGAISLTETGANGTFSAGTIVSQGTLTLSATGTPIRLTNNTALTATDAVNITGTIDINNGLTVTGASVSMGGVTTRPDGPDAGPGNVTITATTGNVGAGTVASRGGIEVAANAAGATVTLGGADAQQGVLVTAGGAATISGAVTTRNSNDYIVRAASVTAGTDNTTVAQTAAGGLLLQANGGAVTLRGALGLTAGNNQNLVIDAGSAAIVGNAGVTLTNNVGAVLLVRDAASVLTLGNVTGASLATGQRNAPGQATVDYSAVVPNRLTAGADLTLGTINIGSPIDILATAGNIVLNSAISTGSVSVVANAGTLEVGRVGTADNVNSDNANVTLRSETASATVRAAINAGTGAVAIGAGTDVVLGRAATVLQQGGSIAVTAGGRIIGNNAITLQSSGAGGITLSAGVTIAPVGIERSIQFDSASRVVANGSGALVIETNPNLSGLALGEVSAAGLTTPMTIAGAVDVRELSIGAAFALRSGGDMAIGQAVTTGGTGNITLLSGGALTLGRADAGGSIGNLDVQAGAGGISVTPTLTVNTVELTGQGGRLDAIGTIRVFSPGAVTIASTVTADGALLTLDSGAQLTVSGKIESQGRVVALGSGVTVGAVESRNDIVIVGRTGNVTTGTLDVNNPDVPNNDPPRDANGNLIVDPTTNPPTTIGGLPEQIILIRAAGTAKPGKHKGAKLDLIADLVELDDTDTTDPITATGRRIIGGDLTTTQNIRLIATGTNMAGLEPDGIFVGSLNAGLDIVLQSAASIAVTGSITTNPTTGGPVTLTALSGEANVTGAVSVGGGNDYIVRANSIVQGGNITAGGGVLLQSGLGDITAPNPITITASNGQLVLDAGDELLGAAPNLVASGNVLIGQGKAGAPLSLGDVTALALVGIGTAGSGLLPADYQPSLNGELLVGGAISLGNVDVVNSLLIRNSAGNISIASASSDGAIEIRSALDLLIGENGQPRAFTAGAGSSGMILQAQRSILGFGTLTIGAPSLTLAAGTIAPVVEEPNNPTGLSVVLANSTITTGGATEVVAGAGFNGLTLQDVTAGSFAAAGNNNGLPGVNGPITARLLDSLASMTVRSVNGAVSIGEARVTGPASDLIVQAATSLSIGPASATRNVELRADGGSLLSTGVTSAGQDLFLRSSGNMVANAQLVAGRDLKAKAGGSLSFQWVSDVQDQQSGAGRDVVADGGTSTEVRQIGAGDDLVLIARSGDLTIPLLATRVAGIDLAEALNGADGVAVTNPRSGSPVGSLAGRNLVLLATGTLQQGSYDQAPQDLGCDGINCGFSLNAEANSITARDVRFANGSVRMVASNAIDLRSVVAGTGINLNAGTNVTIGQQAGAPAVVVNNSGNSEVRIAAGSFLLLNGDLNSGGDVVALANSGDLSVGRVTGRTIAATATRGKLQTGALTAGTLVDNTLQGGSIVLAATRAAGDPATAGDISIGAFGGRSVLQSSSISITGASQLIETRGSLASTGTVTAGGSQQLSIGTELADNVQAIGAGGNVTLSALANATVQGFIAAPLATVAITAPVVGTDAINAGTIRINGVTSVDTGTLTAGNVDVEATGGTVRIAAISGGTVLVEASGDTEVVGDITTSDDNVIVRAGEVNGALGTGDLKLGNVNAGTGNVTLSANNGTLQSGTISGGVVELAASGAEGDVTLTQVQKASSLIVRAGRNITANSDINIEGSVNLDAETGLVDLQGVLNAASLIGEAATTIKATGNINVQGEVRLTGGTGVEVKAVNSVNDAAITLTTTNGTLNTGALSGGAITLTATNGNAVIDAVTEASSLTVTTGTTLGIGAISNAGVITLDAGGALTMASVAGSTSLNARSRNANVIVSVDSPITVTNAVTITGQTGVTTRNVTSTQGGAIGLTATNGTLETGTLSGGAITLAATNGNAVIGAVTQASGLTVTTGTTLGIGAISNAGAITLDAGGALTMAGVSGSGSLNARSRTASVLANGPINVANAVTVTGQTGVTVQAVNSSANAAIGLTATTGALGTGALSGGVITLAANSGNATIGSVTRAASVGGTASGSFTVLGDTTAQGGVVLTGGTGVSTQAVTSTGGGAITATAATGNVVMGTLSGGAITVQATTGAITNVAGITASTSVEAQALSNATLGNVTSTGAVTARAGQIGGTAGSGTGTLALGAITAGSGAITLRANNGAITGAPGTSGTGILSGGAISLTATGAAGNISLGGVGSSSSLVASASGTVTARGALQTTGPATFTTNRLDLNGALNAGTGAVLITANAAQTGAVAIAGGANGNAETNLFDAGDMDSITAGSVQIDAGSRNVEIGTATLFRNGGNVGVRTTGDIDVTGVLTFTTGRTLTLGGDALLPNGTAASGSDGLATQARNIVVRSAENAAAAGQIVAPTSTVRLNGRQVIVGVATGFRDTLLASRDAPAAVDVVRRSFTENPVSTFYVARPIINPNRFPTLTASTLVLRVQNWGVIQNTDFNAQPGGGVDLGNIRLFAATGAPQGGPVVGFFGKLGGQEGIAAALRLNVNDLGGITPNNVRINGCVALTTAGCIVTGLPLPLVQINDPGRALLIKNAPDLILPLDLISGTTNEALWRDDEDLAPSVPVKDPGTNPPRPGDGLP